MSRLSTQSLALLQTRLIVRFSRKQDLLNLDSFFKVIKNSDFDWVSRYSLSSRNKRNL